MAIIYRKIHFLYENVFTDLIYHVFAAEFLRTRFDKVNIRHELRCAKMITSE